MDVARSWTTRNSCHALRMEWIWYTAIIVAYVFALLLPGYGLVQGFLTSTGTLAAFDSQRLQTARFDEEWANASASKEALSRSDPGAWRVWHDAAWADHCERAELAGAIPNTYANVGKREAAEIDALRHALLKDNGASVALIAGGLLLGTTASIAALFPPA